MPRGHKRVPLTGLGLKATLPGHKRVQLMGLGLKATLPLGLWSFWRISVRLQSRLKVCADSRNLEGFGGCPGVKKGFN